MSLANFVAHFLFFISPLTNPGEDVSDVSSSLDRPFTIFVEGNVGSGKSTLLNYFSQNRKEDVEVVFEPVPLWQNVSGTDLLGKMFEDEMRWAGTFQLYSSLTR